MVWLDTEPTTLYENNRITTKDDDVNHQPCGYQEENNEICCQLMFSR